VVRHERVAFDPTRANAGVDGSDHPSSPPPLQVRSNGTFKPREPPVNP
jgi:hypothetical protein